MPAHPGRPVDLQRGRPKRYRVHTATKEFRPRASGGALTHFDLGAVREAMEPARQLGEGSALLQRVDRPQLAGRAIRLEHERRERGQQLPWLELAPGLAKSQQRLIVEHPLGIGHQVGEERLERLGGVADLAQLAMQANDGALTHEKLVAERILRERYVRGPHLGEQMMERIGPVPRVTKGVPRRGMAGTAHVETAQVRDTAVSDTERSRESGGELRQHFRVIECRSAVQQVGQIEVHSVGFRDGADRQRPGCDLMLG